MILSQSAAGRVEQVDNDYLRARVGALAQVAGNPYGAAVCDVGDGSAFLVEALPNPLFNHVTGLTASSAGDLPDLAHWYAGYGRPLRVDVTPTQASPELFAALAGQGLSQIGFYAGLYGEAVTAAGPDQDGSLRIGPVDPQEFAQVYVEGFGFPTSRHKAMAVSIQVLAERQDTRFYGARIGACTVGVGLLFISDTVGYLATAATLVQYRGRGVQSGLVRHRINAASQAGCDLIVGHTAVGGASQRTMERSGLRLAYTKAIWSTQR